MEGKVIFIFCHQKVGQNHNVKIVIKFDVVCTVHHIAKC